MSVEDALLTMSRAIGNLEGQMGEIHKSLEKHDGNDDRRHREIMVLVQQNAEYGFGADRKLSDTVYSLQQKIGAIEGGAYGARLAAIEEKSVKMKYTGKGVLLMGGVFAVPFVATGKISFSMFKTIWSWVW